MAILIPEIEIHNTLKAVLTLIRLDFEQRSNEQDTILYKLLGANKLQRYELFEQAKTVFLVKEDNPRFLDVQMFFNMKRASIPTIHITLPSENSGQDGLSIDEGYRDYDVSPGMGSGDLDQTAPNYTRRFDTKYNLVITSDNTNEVILIYHLLRAILIPVFDHFNQLGIENCKLSGGDIQNNNTLVPDHIFMRNIGLAFSYEVTSQGLFRQDIIQKIILEYDIIIEPGISESEEDTSDIVITPRYLTCSTLKFCPIIEAIEADILALQESGVAGLSAYEVAIANGFVGTEAQWLLSLVGADGAQGIPGNDGVDGLTTSVNGVTQVTGNVSLETSNIPESAVDYKYVTDAEKTILSNTSGTNSGDNAPNSNSNAYADSLVIGLLDDRGNWNPSAYLDAYPETEGLGSGIGGAVLKGDIWTINNLGSGVESPIGGRTVTDGDTIRALVDAPGQVDTNWAVFENNFGYAAENQANKTETVAGNETSTTKYLSIKGIYDWATGLFQTLSNLVTAWQVTPDNTHYPSEKLVKDSLDLKLDLLSLPSNLTLYPTDTISSIPGYYLMVNTIDAVEYNTVAVDITTPAINTTAQLVAELVSNPGIIIGNPGELPNVSTVGKIKRLSGSGTATFYFEIYHRDLAGIETLIGVSDNTLPVDIGLYVQYDATVLWNNGIFVATDMVVVKYYANRIAGGSNPVFDIQFGGLTPTRTFIPVPSIVIPESPFFYIGVNFEAVETWTYRAPEQFKINTVDNPDGIVYTIEVNAVAYNLTDTILLYDVVTISGDIIGFLKLNCELL